MPNHFHLVIRTHADGDLGRWVRWLLMAHAQRYHRHYQTTGHVWQGRYKAFPVQDDDHLVGVLPYVERNAPRAELVVVPRTGGGQACRRGSGVTRGCGEGKCQSGMRGGWSGLTSRCRGLTSGD